MNDQLLQDDGKVVSDAYLGANLGLAAAHGASDNSPRTLIEVAGSLVDLDEAAVQESWRKEIYRPIYHTHKWWAQRLGSVFRGLVIACLSGPETRLSSAFSLPLRFSDSVVFDPFMGSGTTLGEAYKLDCTTIGQDINPVACAPVTLMFSMPTLKALSTAFEKLQAEVSPFIKSLYKSTTSSGDEALGMYYFWVKVILCPACSTEVPLFSTFVFSKHAYPTRFPAAKAICISCDSVNDVRAGDTFFDCVTCGNQVDLTAPPAKGSKVCCTRCRHIFDIAKTYAAADTPPKHRMYAKIVLDGDGRKQYSSISDVDSLLYDSQHATAATIRSSLDDAIIEPGYNTDQVLRYHYRNWHEFFNDRQLVALDRIASAIQPIENDKVRLAFGVLFSGVLEFNNMFASFKGEGTGAVRHMFSHHILKPEKMPLEANVWGTPQSSGSFSTMYSRRLLRAIEYGRDPWDLRLQSDQNNSKGSRVGGISRSFTNAQLVEPKQLKENGNTVSVRCGNSQNVDLPDKCVDLVLTDPPFFNNVHYSELADFFWTWQRKYGFVGVGVEPSARTTRSNAEVQSTDGALFSKRLGAVFRECRRILKPSGLLVFTYHHSNNAGWLALAEALEYAQFNVVQSHSVKSEMSVASPKTASKAPIDRDIVIVARPSDKLSANHNGSASVVEIAEESWKGFLIDAAILGPRVASRVDAWNLLASKVLVNISNTQNSGAICERVFSELRPRFDGWEPVTSEKSA